MGTPTSANIAADMIAAIRQPQVTIIQPMIGTMTPERPGPERNIPKAKLRRSRNNWAIKRLIGMW